MKKERNKLSSRRSKTIHPKASKLHVQPATLKGFQDSRALVGSMAGTSGSRIFDVKLRQLYQLAGKPLPTFSELLENAVTNPSKLATLKLLESTNANQTTSYLPHLLLHTIHQFEALFNEVLDRSRGLFPVDVNAKSHSEKDSETALHLACKLGNLNAVRTLLRNSSIDVNILDSKGRTPLYYACVLANADIIKTLIESEKVEAPFCLGFRDEDEEPGLHGLVKLPRKEFNEILKLTESFTGINWDCRASSNGSGTIIHKIVQLKVDAAEKLDDFLTFQRSVNRGGTFQGVWREIPDHSSRFPDIKCRISGSSNLYCNYDALDLAILKEKWDAMRILLQQDTSGKSMFQLLLGIFEYTDHPLKDSNWGQARWKKALNEALKNYSFHELLKGGGPSPSPLFEALGFYKEKQRFIYRRIPLDLINELLDEHQKQAIESAARACDSDSDSAPEDEAAVPRDSGPEISPPRPLPETFLHYLAMSDCRVPNLIDEALSYAWDKEINFEQMDQVGFTAFEKARTLGNSALQDAIRRFRTSPRAREFYPCITNSLLHKGGVTTGKKRVLNADCDTDRMRRVRRRMRDTGETEEDAERRDILYGGIRERSFQDTNREGLGVFTTSSFR